MKVEYISDHPILTPEAACTHLECCCTHVSQRTGSTLLASSPPKDKCWTARVSFRSVTSNQRSIASELSGTSHAIPER